MFLLNIVDFHFGSRASAGVVGSQSSCFFKRSVRQFFVVAFDNNMGARHFLCVEPPVIAGGELKGQLFVLVVIFSYINMIAVTGNIVKRLGFFQGFFLFGVMLLIYALGQFFFNLGQVAFCQCNIQSRADRLQMQDFFMGFFLTVLPKPGAVRFSLL